MTHRPVHPHTHHNSSLFILSIPFLSFTPPHLISHPHPPASLLHLPLVSHLLPSPLSLFHPSRPPSSSSFLIIMSPSQLLSLLVVFVLVLCSSAQLTPNRVNDINILNFALTLENTDSTFFSTFLAAFNPTTGFTQAQFVAAGYNASVYTNLVQIATEEIAHAAILMSTIAALGGVPYPKCVYNFSGVHDVLSYLTIGQFFEATGTGAYDGTLNGLTDPGLQQATAAIATVEARHSAYLNQLLGVAPFPASAFDPAYNTSYVAAAIAPFQASCPYNVTLPLVPRPYGVALNGTNGTLFTGNLSASVNMRYNSSEAANDLAVLNYALVLEQLESYFYATAQRNFSAAAFAAAGFNASVYSYFTTIALNEQIHVGTLRAVITARGGTPVPNCTYSFPVTTVADYFRVAAILENTGVSAYDGAANAITDTALQQVAATIATVEARHAAIINLLNGVSPFPTTNDTALTPSQVVQAASAFQNCPFTPVLPSVAPLQVPAVTNAVGVSGDPSFVGFLGQQFQLHGIPNRVFNLLTNSRLQLNSRFAFIGEGQAMTGGQMKQARMLRSIVGKALPDTKAWSHEGTFLSEMGLKLDGTQLHLTAGAYATGMSVEVDGVQLQPSATPIQVAADLTVSFPSAHVLSVSHPLLSFSVVNSDRFFNIEQAALQSTAAALDLDGLLGQTHSADANNRVMGGSSAVREHLLLDYLVSDDNALFSDDFVRNRFAAKAQ